MTGVLELRAVSKTYLDGADEVHKVTIARQTLKGYKAVEGWPSEHVPTRRAAALEKFAEIFDIESANS